jgi:hypothetical protein
MLIDYTGIGKSSSNDGNNSSSSSTLQPRRFSAILARRSALDSAELGSSMAYFSARVILGLFLILAKG